MRPGCSTSPARDRGCRTRRRPWRGAWRSRSPPRAVEPWTAERAVLAAAVEEAAQQAPADEAERAVGREPAVGPEPAAAEESAVARVPAAVRAPRGEPVEEPV